MRALSIRQPWAELILQGRKTVEYRSRPTRIIGEEFYIYAARGKAGALGVRGRLTRPAPRGRGDELPTGLLVGTAVITRCVRHNGEYHWHLAAARRLARPRKPMRMPQPVWFNPF